MSDADAHDGRTTSANNVINKGGGAVGKSPGRIHRQKSDPQTKISQKAAAIAVETAVVVAAAAAVAADNDMGDNNVDNNDVGVNSRQQRQ